jgi:hypothetical protein
VVWNHDKDIRQRDGTIVPTLGLKDRVAPQLHQQYYKLVNNQATIPCAKQLPRVPDLTKTSMLDKALFQRLTHKNSLVYRLLEDNKGDWEATAYQLLAYNFGFKINSGTFLTLSLSLPLKILTKHTDDLLQLEALLLGHAGLLRINSNKTQDAYLEALKSTCSKEVRCKHANGNFFGYGLLIFQLFALLSLPDCYTNIRVFLI